MFTGIITDIGTITHIKQNKDRRLVISTAYDVDTISLGASIACQGVCLTVVEKGKAAAGNWFAVDVSAETLSCTTLCDFSVGKALNLERSLKLGDELGGHLVLGHVDGVGKVLSIQQEGDSHRILFEVEEALALFIAAKGSVTVNGVSLTVNQVEGRSFAVNIIPHTWEKTTFHRLQAGEGVNIEIDMFARYIARIVQGATTQFKE
jgi:riboflavin synthase